MDKSSQFVIVVIQVCGRIYYTDAIKSQNVSKLNYNLLSLFNKCYLHIEKS